MTISELLLQVLLKLFKELNKLNSFLFDNFTKIYIDIFFHNLIIWIYYLRTLPVFKFFLSLEIVLFEFRLFWYEVCDFLQQKLLFYDIFCNQQMFLEFIRPWIVTLVDKIFIVGIISSLRLALIILNGLCLLRL